jgi:hypothetical protein
MKAYHGTNITDFKISKIKNSRYGFPVLFFATDISLAKLYGEYHASKAYLKGFKVFEAELPTHCNTVDFKNKNSYCAEFNNLIVNSKKQNVKILKIVNVIDSPSKEFFKLNNSDIIAVFDFDLINELKQVYEYKSEPYNIAIPQPSLNIFGKEVSEKREEVLNQRFSTELKQQKKIQN